MKKLVKKMEELMVAVTFAEAGEYDEANRQAGNTLQDAAEPQGAVLEGRSTGVAKNEAK